MSLKQLECHHPASQFRNRKLLPRNHRQPRHRPVIHRAPTLTTTAPPRTKQRQPPHSIHPPQPPHPLPLNPPSQPQIVIVFVSFPNQRNIVVARINRQHPLARLLPPQLQMRHQRNLRSRIRNVTSKKLRPPTSRRATFAPASPLAYLPAQSDHPDAQATPASKNSPTPSSPPASRSSSFTKCTAGQLPRPLHCAHLSRRHSPQPTHHNPAATPPVHPGYKSADLAPPIHRRPEDY